jgi:hypothetical protein
LKSKLEDELLAIGYMDKAQTDRHMVAKKLHYKDVNAVALSNQGCKTSAEGWSWTPAVFGVTVFIASIQLTFAV